MKIQSFCKKYDGNHVLGFPETELIPGKIYAVIGANGSGKSTFAKGLAGVISPEKKKEILEKGISVGYMPQKSYGFCMSVEKNIALGGKDEKKAKYFMQMLQLEHLAKKKANRLSGGETARMALARVLMKRFDLVVLDEPTAAMDVETTLLAEKLMMDYCKESGCAMILVTHSLSQAKRVADEVMFFYEGKLVEIGEKKQVLEAPVKEETKRFLEFYGM